MTADVSQPSRWHLITGEYPPHEGRIGDYSALVSAELARLGFEVHVWTTGIEGSESGPDGVTVHRSGQGWTGIDLARIARSLGSGEATGSPP